MQIKVKDFIGKIENEDYRRETILADGIDSALDGAGDAAAKLADRTVSALEAGDLAEVRLVAGDGEDQVSVGLETGIINLPFENIRKVDNFFDDTEAEVPVIVYFVARGRGLNESDFRIMRIAPAGEFVSGQGRDAVSAALADALNQIRENRKEG